MSFQETIDKGVTALNDYKIINGIITNDFFVDVICSDHIYILFF